MNVSVFVSRWMASTLAIAFVQASLVWAAPGALRARRVAEPSPVHDINTLFTFLAERSEDIPDHPDLLIVCGNPDHEAIGPFAAQLYREFQPKWVLVTGKGPMGSTGTPEAELYREVLEREGVPAEKILLETESTNAGQNAQFGARVLKGHRVEFTTVVLVQTPLGMWLTRLIFERQFLRDPDRQHQLRWDHPSQLYSYAPPLPPLTQLSIHQLISLLETAFGEMDRIQPYAAQGFLNFNPEMDLPPQVREAHERLRQFHDELQRLPLAVDRHQRVMDSPYVKALLELQTLPKADQTYAKGLHEQFRSPAKTTLRIGEHFWPSALLTEAERTEQLGAVDYQTTIKGQQDYLAIARHVELIVNPMDGGLGANLSRESYLAHLWSKIHRTGEVALGAKGTDLYFPVQLTGYDAHGLQVEKDELVSIMELKYLRLIREAPAYRQVAIQELVNDESQKSVQDFLNTPYLPDRLDDRIAPAEKRMYRQVIEASGHMTIRPHVVQHVLPAIDAQTGALTTERRAPGGHGQLGTILLHEASTLDRPSDAPPLVRAIYNGDGTNNAVSPAMVGWMVKEGVPVVMVTTTKTGIDLKGGLIGVERVGEVPVAQMMELAQAREAGQEAMFYDIGLPQADDIPRALAAHHQPGAQYFNTNVALLNYSVLAPFLRALKARIGEERFAQVITPDLIMNEKKQNGRRFFQLEGALGSALLNLNRFVLTDPDALALWRTMSRSEQFLRFINLDPVERTNFFTPVKYSFDFWHQAHSDAFALEIEAGYLTGRILNLRPGHLPQLNETFVQSAYYMDLQNVIDALADASTQDLDSLEITGRVTLAHAILRGTVRVTSAYADVFDLNAPAARQQLGQGENEPLVLDNVEILIDQWGVVTVMPFSGPGASASDAAQPASSDPEVQSALLVSL